MISDIRKEENYNKMLSCLKKQGMEYYDLYKCDENHDYGESVHLVVGMNLSPIKLHIELEQKNDVIVFSFWVSIKTNKFMFEGDTSDCTDVISSVMTILINFMDDFELSLTDMFNPTYVEGEIFGRDIAFIDSEFINADFISCDFMGKFEKVTTLVFMANMIMCKIINFQPYCNDIVELTDKEYITGIKNVFGTEVDIFSCNYIRRKNEDWEWAYNGEIGISSIHFRNKIGEKLLELNFKDEIIFISGVKRNIISYNNKVYAIDKEKLKYINKILNYYKENKYNIVAIRNKFFVITPNTIISVFDECGLDSVDEEKKLIRERRKLEDKILFGESSFKWNHKIDGGRFEDLIREILAKDMYVSRVRKAGPTNQPDNGLDLIIEYIDFDNGQYKEEESPFKIKKIIGQCKAYNGTVGKSDVKDIRDTLDYYDADGYWLFVSSQISVHLSEYLQKLRDKNQYLIDWWNRSEIEEALKNFPEVIVKYKDILSADRY